MSIQTNNLQNKDQLTMTEVIHQNQLKIPIKSNVEKTNVKKEYVLTYIHTYMHAYIHTYIHTSIYEYENPFQCNKSLI